MPDSDDESTPGYSQGSTVVGHGGAVPVAARRVAADPDPLGIVDATKYELGKELARGGMGRIRHARDRRLRRQVAIKELIAPDAGLAQRFEREALITARLQHPSIVSIYEAGRWRDGTPFFAMRLVPGRSLHAVIKERKTFRDRLALLPNAIAVCEALAYAHSEGIVHRDLKPANVLVGPFGETVVIDWGLAKDLADAADDDAPATPAPASGPELTVAGAVMGTPGYMPREQAAGKPVDERADVYALGAIVFHVLTGTPPFTGSTTQEVIERLLASPAPPVAIVEPEVPPDLAAIVDKALATDPVDRYPTAAELAADLVRFQAGQLVGARRYTSFELVKRWIRRHRAAVAVAAVAVATLAVFGAISVSRVIRERDRANDKSEEAERQRAAAVAAEARAAARADDAVIAQARAWLATDPSRGLAWLARLSDRPPSAAARAVAASAIEAGVGIVLAGHDREVIAVAYAPGGATIATADVGGTIRLWSARGRPGSVLRGHTRSVAWLAFSPDGAWLVSAGADHAVRRWDVRTGTGTVVASSPGGREELASFAFGAGGELAASAGDGTIVELAPDGSTLATLHQPAQTVIVRWVDTRVLALLPAGVALVGRDGTATPVAGLDVRGMTSDSFSPSPLATPWTTMVRDGTASAIRIDTGEVKPFAGKFVAALSPDASLLATAPPDAQPNTPMRIRVYNVARGFHDELTRLPGSPRHLVFSPDGALLAGSTDGREITVWSVANGASLVLRGHTESVDRIAFSPDAMHLVSGAGDRSVRLWDLAPLRWRTLDIRSRIGQAAALPGGGAIVVAAKAVWRWTVRGGLERLGDAPTEVVGISLDAKSFAVWTLDAIRVTTIGGATREVAASGAPIASIAVAGDGGRVAWLRRDERAIHAADLATGRTRDLALGDAGVISTFAPDDTEVAVVDRGGAVQLWDLATGEHRVLAAPAAVERHPTLGRLRFSADGRRLALARGNDILVWDTAGGEPAIVLAGHEGPVRPLVFAGDTQLISGSDDHAVRIWDIGPGTVRVLSGHDSAVVGLELSADGATLVSREASRVRRWDLATGRSVAIAPAPNALAIAGLLGDGSVFAIDDGGYIGGRSPSVRIITDDVPQTHADFAAWIARTATVTPE